MKILFLLTIAFVLFGFGSISHSFAVDIITNDNFAVVGEEPEKFKNIWAKLSGVIENKQVFEDGIGYVFKVGGSDSARDTVWLGDLNNYNFSIGDCLIIEGKTGEVNELTNSFGNSFETPSVKIEKFSSIDCLEAIYPTIAENDVSQTQTSGRIVVTVEKVQLAEEHTRVLLTIENTACGTTGYCMPMDLSFYSFNSILVQDKSQFKTDDFLFGVEYEKPNSDIPSGLVETGWVIFEPVDSKPFEIRLNFYEDWESWEISGEKDLVFSINSLTKLDTSVTPTPTKTPTSSQTIVKSTTSDTLEEIKELKKKISELESANKKLQNTIDELQSKLTQSGDSTPKTKKEIASFVDETKDPQSYVDRYNNESSYKEWFDENYPDYTIHEAVGKRQPIPDWIKNNAIWWSEGKLSEDEFVGGIEYLVKNKIINVD